MPPLPPKPIADVLIAGRQLAQRALDLPLPPEVALWNLSMGVARTHVVGTIAELGVADHLGGGAKTAEELAGPLGVDADVLHRVLRVGAMEGVLSLDRRGRFKLTRVGRALRSDAKPSLRSWVRYMALESTTRAWGALTESVRTGEGGFELANGKAVWDWFAEHPDEESLFAAGMRSMTELDLPAVVSAYPWPESGTVCDVAGGVGTVLAAILRERPGLRGVLVDAPGVLKEAETHLANEGVRARVELSPGDMFNEVTARGDVYVLKNVLHDWDDAACARILATVRAAMPSGSTLVLIEQLQERNDTAPYTPLVDVHMQTQCVRGRERSVAEFHTLMDGAGIRPGRVRETAITAVLEGEAV